MSTTTTTPAVTTTSPTTTTTATTTTTTTYPPTTTTAPPTTDGSADEKRVLELVNIERANHNLPPLAWHNALADTARAHSIDMATRSFFHHVCPSGRSMVERVYAAGIHWGVMLAESVASGQTTPEQVVRDWMASPGHAANILNNEATHLA